MNPARRDAKGRFVRGDDPPPERPWTIFATHTKKREIEVVNRRRDRLISRVDSTRVRFATEAEAADFLARLPRNPRWTFRVHRA